jgi:hypothetical protein
VAEKPVSETIPASRLTWLQNMIHSRTARSDFKQLRRHDCRRFRDAGLFLAQGVSVISVVCYNAAPTFSLFPRQLHGAF